MDKKKELESAEQELKTLQVHECEVYSRVCGYYRPTRNFNIGKKQEYSERKVYDSAKQALN